MKEYFETTDNKNRKYVTFSNQEETECTLSWKGQTIVFKGYPRITVRDGESVFGEQIKFDFYITNLLRTYPTNGNHELIEIYFGKEQGIAWLKNCIKRIEDSTRI